MFIGCGTPLTSAITAALGGGQFKVIGDDGLLASFVAFTRADAGTFLGSNGLLQSAAANTPRYDYSPSLQLRGLLIEPAHTNLLTYSEQANNGAWVKVACPVTADAIAGPTGATTADKLVPTAASTLHCIYRDAPALTNGSTYVASIFAKAAEYSKLHIADIGAGRVGASFDLTNGTLIASYGPGYLGYEVDDYGNGWYRCAVIFNAGASALGLAYVGYPTGASNNAAGSVFTGDASSGIYVFGMELVAGTRMLSYVPSVAASASMAADVAAFTIPSGVDRLTYTFDNETSQATPVSPGAYTIPTDLLRRRIKRAVGTKDTASAYQGVVATRSIMGARVIDTAVKQAQIKTYHYARDSITALRLLFTDWYSSNETGSGSPSTISASIEYNGTRHRVTFSGSNDGTIPSGGELLSDELTVSIPNGAKFFIHQWKRNATGMVYNDSGGAGGKDSVNGDIAFAASSGQTDVTMTGDPSSGSAYSFTFTQPAVIATTTRPSFLIVGDSKSVGLGGRLGGNSARGDSGEFSQIGANYGYINAGITGDTAVVASTNFARRLALAGYVSHVLGQWGINDVGNTAYPAWRIKSAMQTLWAGFTSNGRKYFHGTITPDNLSGTPAPTNPVRVEINNWLRAMPTGLFGVIELADVVETARDSGLWKAGYTTDLLHENETGYAAIETADLLSGFTRP